MIVAGFGFRQDAGLESLLDALHLASEGREVDRLAAPKDKSEGAVFQALADRLNLPVVAVAPDALAAQTTITMSPASMDARGTSSVAEAAALAAVGDGGRLLGARVVSTDRQATCALAEGGPS